MVPGAQRRNDGFAFTGSSFSRLLILAAVCLRILEAIDGRTLTEVNSEFGLLPCLASLIKAMSNLIAA
ncbi:hypothetical protein TorRG33x02_145760 [Trema orientale]|uniref:Uncharacterized protein n=1 Tax=Trema orientale TaxID=63057 RepID=A0A2P5EVM4_TREOI|nr:hypothetical protein TorRG33x02_145760 [Trema orientale]